MVRTIIITMILFTISSTYSQDCLDKVAKQAVVIDSLQKVIKQFDKLMNLAQTNQKVLSDTIKSLSSDLSSIEKFKAQKKSFDDLLKAKNDSIAILNTKLLEKDGLIATIKQEGDKKALEEYKRGKTEELSNLVNTYKKPFDNLIKSSSKDSAKRDMQLVGNIPEVMPVSSDLQVYFNALELLSKKFDLAQIKNSQIQLSQIKQKSVLLEKLKESIDKYQIFNDGLKETLNKIVALDRLESVAGMGDEIQKLKFNKILSELSVFIFNYDFNFTDYPYLADIVLEILKRKHPNADADIKDLLKKI